MPKSVLEALFYGKINPWECRFVHESEHTDVEKRIQSEKDYFKDKMPPDDYRRLETLENLYTQASVQEEVSFFSHGFTIGALIMLEISECWEAFNHCDV